MTPEPTRRSFRAELDGLAERGLFRELRTVESPQEAYVVVAGRRLCCLCSNNYLGLANHSAVAEAARSGIKRWGWGAGASRLVSGHMTPHAQLESRLATFKRTAGALVFPTGYQANLATVRAVAGAEDILFIDKLNHASIVDAARGSGALLRVFPHRDYGKLARLLDRGAKYRRRVIVTDTLFSMDGDFADLPRLVELKRRYDALLVVDEAHATGVFGEHGRGLAEQMGAEEGIDATVGTLSKALGGIGGFVAGSRELIDLLVNTGGAFIYTTAQAVAGHGRLVSRGTRQTGRCRHQGIDQPDRAGDCRRCIGGRRTLQTPGAGRFPHTGHPPTHRAARHRPAADQPVERA